MFAPNYIENKLKFFPHIKEAVCFGDARDRVCAFINIDFEAVGNWAERKGLPYAGYTDLAGKPEVLAMMRSASRRSTPTWPARAWPPRRSRASWCCTRSWTRRRRADPHAQGAPRLHRREIRRAGRRAVRRQAEQFIETR
jgi:hypothetical protein